MSTCPVAREVVVDVKMLYMARGAVQQKRFNALSDMLSDNVQAQQVLKATLDAMALLPA